MFLNHTVDPSLSFLNFDCLSWLSFCWACCLSTLSAVLGLRKSSRVRIRLPNNSSQGVVPVVAWGVSLWVARVLLSLDRNVPSWFLFNPAFTICTARSASPFDAGWYGTVVTRRMPFTLRNASNSELTKQLPLSVTTVSGKPNCANISRQTSMTAAEVAVVVCTASIHLEWASIIANTIFPSKGPA